MVLDELKDSGQFVTAEKCNARLCGMSVVVFYGITTGEHSRKNRRRIAEQFSQFVCTRFQRGNFDLRFVQRTLSQNHNAPVYILVI
ncbi:MAG TPA: hypothetical protein VF938_08795, partial [Candidatus Angelobacter sp.]